MELHQLRYFVAVAAERHFTKAAHGLRIAQPSVSRAIRVLEEELGAPLFHRMTGNVALTPAGETLLPWARRVLADVDGATGEVRELADLRRGRLAVGATPSLTITLLPPALAKFRRVPWHRARSARGGLTRPRGRVGAGRARRGARHHAG